MEELNHNSSYEFLGDFWYIDKPKMTLSGKLSYTPERGIKLELQNIFDSSPMEINASKIMHAALVYNGEIKYFTLFDVFLNSETMYSSVLSHQYITGSAKALVFGKLLFSKQIKSLSIEYDSYFKSVIYKKGEEVTQALQYERKPLKTSVGKIKLDVQYSGRLVSYEEDVDELLWTFPKDNQKLIEIKKQIYNILKDSSITCCNRTSSYSTVSFEKGTKIIDNYLNVEKIWRTFWELIMNHPISVVRAWVRVLVRFDKEKKQRFYWSYPMLFSYINKASKKKYSEAPHKNFLPLTIDSFGSKTDLSKISPAFSKWLDMSNDKKLHTLMAGISKIIYRESFITADDYISLIAYIETAMDFLGKKENTLASLIEQYADKKWMRSMEKIIGKMPKKDNAARFLTEVRNVIVHPQSAMKTGGIYLDFAMDDFKLQAAYAYLVGLLIKAIMKNLYDFKESSLDKYVNKVISARRYYKIIFK